MLGFSYRSVNFPPNAMDLPKSIPRIRFPSLDPTIQGSQNPRAHFPPSMTRNQLIVYLITEPSEALSQQGLRKPYWWWDIAVSWQELTQKMKE